MTERLCVERRYIFLNPKWLKEKMIYPGEPDVYVRVPMRSTSSKGRATHGFMDYVIEIETRASAESVVKKGKQFEDNVINHELLIINLGYLDEVSDDWKILEAYIAARLPT